MACRQAVVLLLLFTVVARIPVASAGQPSFDCGKASTWAEVTVCNDEGLSDLDRRLAELYRSNRAALRGEQQKNVIRDQRKWVRERESCAKRPDRSGCLVGVYKARIAQLGGELESSPRGGAAASSTNDGEARDTKTANGDLKSVTVTVGGGGTAPTLTFTALPTSIASRGISTLTWDGTNATACTASGDWTGSKPVDGSQSVSPTATRTYILECTGTGGSVTKSVVVMVSQGGGGTPTLVFNASKTNISHGESITLTWESANTTSCYASYGWSGSKPLSGTEQLTPTATKTYTLTPTATKTYTLTCSNALNAQYIAKSVTVTVTDTTPPTVPKYFQVVAHYPTQVTLYWAASQDNVGVTAYHAERCTGSTCTNFSQIGKTANTSYNNETSEATTYCYRVRAADAAGNFSGYSGVLTVTTPKTPTLPTLTFTATPATINSGQTTKLEWNSKDATSCKASNGWSGTKPLSGYEVLKPTAATTIYELTCTGAAGTVMKSVEVTVEDMARPGHPGWQAAEGTGCLVWNSEPGGRDPSRPQEMFLLEAEVAMVTWSGPCEDGRASGEGELVWRNRRGSDLSRYVGEMRDGKMNGHGRLSIKGPGSEEMWYEGELRDDEPHGRGTIGSGDPGPKGLKSIEGDFVTSDQIAGPARVIWVNGDRYEGEIVQGDTGFEQNGRGKMTKANGDWYEGEWSGGFADGEGQAKIGDKKYSGVWARGCLRSTEQRAAWDVPRHECP